MRIVSLGSKDISKQTQKDIIEIISSTSAKRVVIDSITTLSYLVPPLVSEQTIMINNEVIKRFIYGFLDDFCCLRGVTTLFISQREEKTVNQIMEFSCDGVLSIEYESLGGDFSRSLVITKLRRTKHNEEVHPLEISSDGVKLHDLH
jgi:KaiC/GvpD/RAD55 family RecA-like ATPase